jgi:hypothetical protein
MGGSIFLGLQIALFLVLFGVTLWEESSLSAQEPSRPKRRRRLGGGLQTRLLHGERDVMGVGGGLERVLA